MVALAFALIVALAGLVTATLVWRRPPASASQHAPAPIAPGWVGRWLPEGPAQSLAMAVVAAAIIGIVLTLLGLYASRRAQYGWSIFVLTPFVVGFVAASLASYRRSPSLRLCAGAGALAAIAAGLGFLALGVEGIVCLLMAAPITVPMAAVGGLFAFFWHARRAVAPGALGVLLSVVPVGMAVEPSVIVEPPVHTVRSRIDIDAPSAAVWARLVEFEPITAPLDRWFFRGGVAYPISATVIGRGVGAMRICEFSTGRFVETVRIWDEGRRLAFTVEEAPPVLREWTPYPNIHPPHVDGFLVANSADFTLTPLADGRTRLEGTSVYRNHMWPVEYWQLWSDAIVSAVHQRVLGHVKRLAEER